MRRGLKYPVKKPNSKQNFQIEDANDIKLREIALGIQKRTGDVVSLAYLLNMLIADANAPAVIAKFGARK